MSAAPQDDEAAIVALITAQFAALEWDRGGEADWAAFAEGFLPGAPLYPARRPARALTLEAFQVRMRALAEHGQLHSFRERLRDRTVLIFGNVAVALAGCEMIENGETVTRDVNAFLLVRSDERWRIAAQGWDRAETMPETR